MQGLLVIFLILVILYVLIKRRLSYWKNKGVPGPEPTFLIGNIGPFFLSKCGIGVIFNNIYQKYQNYPFVGIYKALTPCLIVREPEFLKNVLVKDFKHFYDNDVYVDKKKDPWLGRNPFVLKGDEWKSTRSKLTPCFSSAKMKFVYPLVEDVCKKMVNYTNDLLKKSNVTTFDAKELCATFTLDSVASCAFGINGKCFEDPNSEFKDLGKRFLSPGSWASFKLNIVTVLPQIAHYLPIQITSDEVNEKLKRTIVDTLKYRKENNVVRNDFLQMMWELHKKMPEFTMNDVVGQAASFFVDGYETSSGVMSFMMFEIARSKEVQSKLREEIEMTIDQNGGKMTYETLSEMEYLNAVFQESLRKHPPLLNLGKTCIEDYEYTTTDTENFKKMTVKIEAGTPIVIPLAAFHTDPKYFEDPEEFRPERFMNENKDTISKQMYLPFGDGQRACLGKRFGILQIKVALINLLRHFEMSVNSKTKVPIQYDPFSLLLAPIGGIWIDFRKIESK